MLDDLNRLSRREAIALAGGLAAGLLIPGIGAVGQAGAQEAPAPTTQPRGEGQRYKIGACDWMLLKRQRLGSVDLVSKLGFDGVEVDMGGLGTRENFDNKLLDPDVRKQFFDAAAQWAVEFSSMAMSAFYAQSYANHPAADRCTQETLATMKAMGVKVCFLPLGVTTPIAEPEIRAKVIERLKRHAPDAEREGLVIGVEAPLDKEGQKRFFDEIGSAAVQSYYNMQSGFQVEELKWKAAHGEGEVDKAVYANVYETLASLMEDKRLSMIHCTDDDGKLVQESRIDAVKLKQTLDAGGWSGWLVCERSRRSGKTARDDFAANAAYLKSIFQA